MFQSQPPEERQLKLRFGGGVNSRASADEINPRECASGVNFDLDVENTSFRPRKPFSLWAANVAASATDGMTVRGFAQLRKVDGTLHTAIQFGSGTGTVYWDRLAISGSSMVKTHMGNTTTSTGLGARLRGNLKSNAPLSDKVVITDLEGVTPVMEWDGSASVPVTMTHNLNTGTDEFYAKYAFTVGERMYYANIRSGPTGTVVDTPHMIVGSEIEDHQILSVSAKPSSALAESDAFYILAPSLRPINGIVQAFGETVFSANYSDVYILSGESAKDFSLTTLYANSGSTGDEGFIFAGNDVVYSRPGYIETLAGVQSFGDVENDDLTRSIKDDILEYEKFRLVFDAATKKLFVFPEGSDTIYVFHKTFYDQLAKDVTLLKSGAALSPWVPWTTTHPAGFQPVTVWEMIDPLTNLPGVFFGDDSGNIYKMDGGDYAGDGDDSAYPVRSQRMSAVISAPVGDFSNVSGWLNYTEDSDATMVGVIAIGGNRVADQEFAIEMEESVYDNYFGDANTHFNGSDEYYGLFSSNRIRKKHYSVAGMGSQLQLNMIVESVNYFNISEVGIEFNG